jgi:hypothetical protein
MQYQQAPEFWMMGPRKVSAKPFQAKPEGIRAWYERTTRSARRAILWATVWAVFGGAAVYGFASLEFLARLQTFNGALTIPVAAAIWIGAFVYIFLIPSRESSFRSQEAVEAGIDIIRRAVEENIKPAADVWRRLGERAEREGPDLVRDFREGLEIVRVSAERLARAVEKNDSVAQEARPVIEALKRLEDRFEREIARGLLDDIRTAAHGIRGVVFPPGADMPDLDTALEALARKDGGAR